MLITFGGSQARADIDKSRWPDGPWKDEVDTLQWVSFCNSNAYPCVVQRKRAHGALCGYAGVGKDHPAFRVGYSYLFLKTAGDLTFSGTAEDMGNTGLHFMDPTNQDIWWLGFDCCDYMPRIHLGHPENYKTVDDVFQGVLSLVEQLHQIKKSRV